MIFSSLVVYKILFFGIVLFFFFRLLKFVLPAIIKNSSTQKKIQKYIPLTEALFWVMFLVWASRLLVAKNQFFAIILLGILLSAAIWGTWFIFKDYIAGLVIRTGSSLNKGENISIDGKNGRIKSFNYRDLQIETDKGKIIQIPYSSILTSDIEKSGSAETISGYTFQLKVEKTKSLKEISKNIKETILYLPWSSLKKDPIIKPVKEEENTYILELTIYSLEKYFFYNIENHLRKTYEN